MSEMHLEGIHTFTTFDLDTIPSMLIIAERFFQLAQSPIEKNMVNNFIDFLNYFDSTRCLQKGELQTILMHVEQMIAELERGPISLQENYS